MAEDEEDRRINAAIARASASRMSNAKWRKLFRALAGRPLRWKFVRDDRVFLAHAPHEAAVLEDRLGDVLPSPYSPYREIDWVEIPAEHAEGVAEALAALGQFPLRVTDGGLRVEGYGW